MKPFTLLHTADWHLGKRLFRVNRITEQRQFITWLLNTAKKQNADALIIAGDIFDTPHPPTEALELFYNFLAQWQRELPNAYLFIIAGNHDSGRFLETPQHLLPTNKIKLIGNIAHAQSITIPHANSNIHFHLFPYFRSNELFEEIKLSPNFSAEAWEEDREYAIKLLTDLLCRNLVEQETNILVAHHAFGQFTTSHSEQAINFAGLNSLPTAIYQNFDYIALGHIHKAQKISSSPPAYYAGSPLPFRFSETNNKSINIVKIGEKIEVDQLPIPLTIKLHTIKTEHENPLEVITQELNKLQDKHYVQLQIKLTTPQPELQDQIQQLFSECDHQLLNTQIIFQHNDEQLGSSEQILNHNIEDIFTKFYQQQTGEKTLSTSLRQEFQQLLATIQQEDNLTKLGISDDL